MDIRDARNRIMVAFPALAIDTIQPFAAGWAHRTWLVNGTLMFRFPSTAGAAETIQREMAVLPQLLPTLPTAIPDYRFRAPRGAGGDPAPFGGYTLVPGVPLATGEDSVDASALAADLGALLAALHSFPVEKAIALGVQGGTAAAWRVEYSGLAGEMHQQAAPYLTALERQRVAEGFERFLQDDRHFAFTPVLLHRDLGPDHVLTDPVNGRLSGLIDFEDMSIGDPAFDFNGLAFLGADLLAAYGHPTDATFGERMQFYTWLWPFHELRYGLESGQQAHIAHAVQWLHESLTI
jgi:aminoglycoside 2''-phosphotransferase